MLASFAIKRDFAASFKAPLLVITGFPTISASRAAISMRARPRFEQGARQIEILPLTSKLRFAALQSGDVDVLTRNTTWTMSRDTELRTDFPGVTFYDGQGVMVRKDSQIRKLSDLREQAICVQSGSTSAINVINHYENLGIKVEVRQFDDELPPSDNTLKAHARPTLVTNPV